MQNCEEFINDADNMWKTAALPCAKWNEWTELNIAMLPYILLNLFFPLIFRRSSQLRMDFVMSRAKGLFQYGDLDGDTRYHKEQRRFSPNTRTSSAQV